MDYYENSPEFQAAPAWLPDFETSSEDVMAFKDAVQTVNDFNLEMHTNSGLPKFFDPDVLKGMKMRLDAQTGPAFSQAGISLSRLKSVAAYRSAEGTWSTGKAELELTDGGAFAGFLLGVSQEDADVRLREGVSQITESFYRSVCRSITYGSIDAQTFEAHVAAESIVSGLEKVGMASYDITHRLAGLAKAFDGYYAEAYAEAEILGLFSEPGSLASTKLLPTYSGPPKLLMENWTSVYRVIRELEAQPEADQVQTQLIQQAWNHLLYAQSYWDNNRHELERKRGSGFALEVDNIISAAFANINSVTRS